MTSTKIASWLLLLGVPLLAMAACSGGEPGPSDRLKNEVGYTEQALDKCSGGVNGDIDYCNNPACPCTVGEGDCDAHSQCTAGLICGEDLGPQFGMRAGWDVCVPRSCTNGIQDAGEAGVDCGGTSQCGSCLGCPPAGQSPGSADYCTKGCPCASGSGDCDSNSDCQSGLVCGTGLGPHFGQPAGNDVCVPSHCTNGTQDADEVAVDCGGVDCGTCVTCPANGLSNTCSSTCPCQAGWGDCDGNAECRSGLVCGTANGPKFGLNGSFDVCVASHCTNGVRETSLGEVGTDCGGECGTCVCPDVPNGRANTCSPWCRCQTGWGDCDTNSECQTGLVCGTANGAKFGLNASLDVCVPSHCTNGVVDSSQGELGLDCGGDCGVCSGCTAQNGTENTCTDSCLCISGRGDCDSDSQCAQGLVCGRAIGQKFNMDASFDVCVPPHCTNGIKDSTETGPDCGGECGTCVCTTPTNGLANTCTPWCPCQGGWGDCDSNSECQSGLVCGTANGARYGLNAAIDVCWAPSCTNGIQDGTETGVDCGGTCGTVGCTTVNVLSCPNGTQGACGPSGTESCCVTIDVPGGSYNRVNDPTYPATISSFKLDKYEVTVGRFRAFLDAYDAWRAAGNPAAGAGAHPLIADTGWDSTWTLPASAAEFKPLLNCTGQAPTWTDTPGANEGRPINCMTWHEAFAFCLWDGGRLPTDAEWGYAAAGDGEQRDYPWGNIAPDATLASYACQADGDATSCSVNDLIRVGSLPNGNGRWGHADLAGNVWDYVFDFYGDLPATCTDCANLTASAWRVIRGGSYQSAAPGTNLRTTLRERGDCHSRAVNMGFRCAR